MPELNTNLLASIGQNTVSYSGALAKSTQLKDMVNQEQLGELQVKQAKAQSQRDQQIADITKKADVSSPEGLTKLAADVTKIDPAKGMDMMKQIQEMMKSTSDTQKSQLEAIGARADIEGNAAMPLLQQYQNMLSKGVPPQQAAAQMQPAYQQALQSLASQKLPDGSPVLGQEQLKQIIAHPTFDPDFVNGIVQQSKQTRDALNAQQKQSVDTAAQQETVRHDKVMEGQGQQKVDLQNQKIKQQSAVGKLDPDTLDYASESYMKTGQMPALGRGDGAMISRIQIMKDAARKWKEMGMDSQAAVVDRSAFKAGQSAYTQVMKSKEMIGNYEKTAIKNMELVRQASAKVDRSGSPIFNKWVLAGQKAIKGDPDVTNLDATITSFVEEYAKVMTGSTGASGSTDSAREHAYGLLNKSMTKEQIQTTLDTLTKEMDNRVSSYDDQLNELNKSMGFPDKSSTTDTNTTTTKPTAAPSATTNVDELIKKYGG